MDEANQRGQCGPPGGGAQSLSRGVGVGGRRAGGQLTKGEQAREMHHDPKNYLEKIWSITVRKIPKILGYNSKGDF